MKVTIDAQAAAVLQSYVGTSLREIINEMEKLVIYIGERTAITQKDVELAVGVSRDFTAFELANMVGEKNISKAQEIVLRLLSSGQSAIPIIAVLSSHFIKVWKIYDGLRQRKPETELAQYAGVSPFFLKQYLTHAKKYTQQEIENVFLILAEADFAVKNSADPKLTLTTAVASIINGTIAEEILQ
jgi:DNA polymerase-3 subunit delta